MEINIITNFAKFVRGRDFIKPALYHKVYNVYNQIYGENGATHRMELLKKELRMRAAHKWKLTRSQFRVIPKKITRQWRELPMIPCSLCKNSFVQWGSKLADIDSGSYHVQFSTWRDSPITRTRPVPVDGTLLKIGGVEYHCRLRSKVRCFLNHSWERVHYGEDCGDLSGKVREECSDCHVIKKRQGVIVAPCIDCVTTSFRLVEYSDVVRVENIKCRSTADVVADDEFSVDEAFII
jgi:hypothetical protein